MSEDKVAFKYYIAAWLDLLGQSQKLEQFRGVCVVLLAPKSFFADTHITLAQLNAVAFGARHQLLAHPVIQSRVRREAYRLGLDGRVHIDPLTL